MVNRGCLCFRTSVLTARCHVVPLMDLAACCFVTPHASAN